MPKYLDEAGVRKLWDKTKKKASEAQSNAVETVGNYTVNGRKINTNPTLSKSDVGLGNVDNVAQIPSSQKGVPNGVATLGSDGKLTSTQLPALKTINGTSIVGSGNITIDLGIYTIVTALPTTGINKNKIYLVLTNEDKTQDRYTEYIYTGDTSAAYDASKWEKLGEYKADVDLSDYITYYTAVETFVAEVEHHTNDFGEIIISFKSLTGHKTFDTVTLTPATTNVNGLMSKADKAKLDGIAAGANAYSHPAGSAPSKTEGLYKISTDAQSHVASVTAVTKADITALGIPAQDTTYSAATTSANGLMSAADKTKLDGIAAGANAYSHPAGSAASKAAGLYKISTDAQSHVASVTAVTKSDITALGIPAQDTTYGVATTSANGLMSASDKKIVDYFNKERIYYLELSNNLGDLVYSDDYVHLGFINAGSDVTEEERDNRDVYIRAATTRIAGVMSAADKTKLDGIVALTDAEIDAILV